MGLLEPQHLILIVFALLLLFGGKKLPELMKGLGTGIKEFKDAQNGTSSTAPAPVAANNLLPEEKLKGESENV